MMFPISLTVTYEGDGVDPVQIFGNPSFFDYDSFWTIPAGANPGDVLLLSARIDEVAGSPVTATRTVLVVSSDPPVNDNLVDAITLVGDSGSRPTGDTNDNGTSEVSENNHDGNLPSSSIWYSWTPSVSGDATIQTAGSDFDTVLAVYTGSGFPLTPIASNDDISVSVTQSRVNFATTASQEYLIAVDGFSGAEGDVELTWNVVVVSTATSWDLYE